MIDIVLPGLEFIFMMRKISHEKQEISQRPCV